MKVISLSLKTLPFFTCFLTLFLGSTLRMGGYPLLPALLLVPVYYWLIYRPGWLPLWTLFCLGILYDSLLGNALGISSLLLMGSALLGTFIRPHLNPNQFSQIWGSFAVYIFIYISLYGLLTAGSLSLLISGLYSLIVFPIFVWGLGLLHQRILAYV